MALDQKVETDYNSDVATAAQATSQFAWSDRLAGSGKCLVEAGGWLLKTYLLLAILGVVVFFMLLSAFLRSTLKGKRRCR